ncbi:serine protease [Deinococcus aerolatus]|uniref:Serine protease n=1 Tax=Deinococcus aerolatus TaxID=522487 RepID=A0ABQ2GCJ5_9DEIO|nr:S8 family serine peptidase [Deinococcus aerolatus]GGL85461.1 serine protease [Deinococcus aerolatus]
MVPQSRNRFYLSLTAATLTAALLASCGSQPNQPPNSQATLTTQKVTSTPDLPKNYKYLHTLSIPASVSRASLQKMYGGYIVAYHPETGNAIIANNNLSKGSYDSEGVEVNSRSFNISVQGFSTWATGFSTWATGFSTWATGFSTWATGTSALTMATTFSQNVPAWNMIQLSQAQSLVPELGQGVKVAVLDTGFDLSHPSFQGKLDIRNAKDFIDGDNVPQEGGAQFDGYGHGTAAASIVLQIAPKVTILPIRVLDADGNGDTSTIASAIDYAVSAGAEVINLSLGSNVNTSVLNTAIQNAVNKGVAVICASGNTGNTAVLFPAVRADTTTVQGYGSVGVGSVGTNFLKSSFSTYGANLEITAPGENLVAAFPGSQIASVTGTSFSTPVVSGIVALALSTGAPNTTAREISAILTNLNSSATAPRDPLFLLGLGYGTVNAYSFIKNYR